MLSDCFINVTVTSYQMVSCTSLFSMTQNFDLKAEDTYS